jgi:phenylacetate-CoA ligase
VDELLSGVDGVSSEYQIMIDHMDGKDVVTVFFETTLAAEDERRTLEKTVERQFKTAVGMTPRAKAVGMGELPRSEKKTPRIFDNRY